LWCWNRRRFDGGKWKLQKGNWEERESEGLGGLFRFAIGIG
jgi:hypothetical protein